jgi:hypothetical protein
MFITSAAQLRAAHALAAVHGHGWGGLELDYTEFEGMPVADACRIITERTIALCPEWPGITPRWDADGDISHSTGSGRLTWLVELSGIVTLSAWRPSDVWACGAVVASGQLVTLKHDIEHCRTRHWEALALAVSAVTGCPLMPPPADILEVEAGELANDLVGVAHSLLHLCRQDGGLAFSNRITYGREEAIRELHALLTKVLR